MSETNKKKGGNTTRVVPVTIAVFMATFMTAVEGTIVSTAMPTIVSDLHGLSLMNWVFSIYMLMTAVTTPIYGKLSDRYGRKKLMNIGLLIFVLGSLLCGISGTMVHLILSRIVQGLGAGAIQPLTFTILADIYPVEKRARMIGLNGSAWGIASIVAPLLGGFIVEQLSWHWVFAINIPIGLVVALMIQVYLHEQVRSRKNPIDYLGIVLLVLALVMLMLGLQNLNGKSIVLLGVVPILLAIVLFIVLVWVERSQEDPILPLKLFHNRTFIIQNVVALLVSGFLLGFETYLPIWMQSVLGLKPSMGGFALTPSSLIWLMGSFLAGRLLMRHPPHRISAVALLFLIASCATYAFLPMGTPFGVFLFISCFYGFGFGLIITISTVTSQSVVSVSDVGTATSFNTLARSLGMTAMISLFGIIMNTVTGTEITKHKGVTLEMMNDMINPQNAGKIPARFLGGARTIVFDGLHWIFVVGLIILVIAFLVNLLDFRSRKLLVDEEMDLANAS